MNNSLSLEDDQPWTTARCNRLLRPISSRLATLRKELERSKAKTAEKARKPPSSSKPRRAVFFESSLNISQSSKDSRAIGFEKTRDPDWMPGTKQHVKNKRTYGGRTTTTNSLSQKSLGEPSSHTCEIGLPTPFISRSIWRLQDSPHNQGSPLQHIGKRRKPLLKKPVEHLQTLKKAMTPDLYKQIDGLFVAYSNVLSATSAGVDKRRKGTRSLMTACLRQIPTYIALEEFWIDVDDKEEGDKRDVSTEIYTELEERGSCGGRGWRPLKQVVRSHATALLCDAIEERYLGLDTLRGIFRLCMNAKAWEEAEKFLNSFLAIMKPLPPPSSSRSDLFDDQTSLYMSMVKEFVDTTWRHQFLYDQLEYMLSQDLLPFEWLATRGMLPVWTRTVRTLSDGSHRTYSNAFRLLETAIYVAAGLPDESVLSDADDNVTTKCIRICSKDDLRRALDTTLSSLLTLLSSISLVSQSRGEEADLATVRSVTWTLDSLAIGLLKRNDMNKDLALLRANDENIESFARRALWIVVAPFLVHLGGCRSGQDLVAPTTPTLASSFQWIITQYSSDDADVSSILESIPSFTASTARCSGKAWKNDGFDQLQRIMDALLSTSGIRFPSQIWSLERLALDSCLEFAQSTNNTEHFAYARKFEKMLSKSGRTAATKYPKASRASSEHTSGFRWEEGIGEWVTCTPFAQQQRKQISQQRIRPLELFPTPINSDVEQDSTEQEQEILREDTQLSILDIAQSSPFSSPVKFVTSHKQKGRSKKPEERLNEGIIQPIQEIHLTPPDSSSTLKDHCRNSQESELTDSNSSLLKPTWRKQRALQSVNKTMASDVATRTSPDNTIVGAVKRKRSQQRKIRDDTGVQSENDKSFLDEDAMEIRERGLQKKRKVKRMRKPYCSSSLFSDEEDELSGFIIDNQPVTKSKANQWHPHRILSRHDSLSCLSRKKHVRRRLRKPVVDVGSDDELMH